MRLLWLTDLHLDHAAPLARARDLGDEAAAYLAGELEQACRAFREILLLTHVPPFQAVWDADDENPGCCDFSSSVGYRTAPSGCSACCAPSRGGKT